MSDGAVVDWYWLSLNTSACPPSLPLPPPPLPHTHHHHHHHHQPLPVWWNEIVGEPVWPPVHPPPPPPPHSRPRNLRLWSQMYLRVSRHNLTCSPDSHWDALELEPFAPGYPLAFSQSITERSSLTYYSNHSYIIVLWNYGPNVAQLTNALFKSLVHYCFVKLWPSCSAAQKRII